MAVYTKISNKILNELLSTYEIGHLINFEEIVEGVENSNFKVITSKNTYILTIFEKRVNTKDLPFFMKLMYELSKLKIKCPKPLKTINGKHLIKLKNKNL